MISKIVRFTVLLMCASGISFAASVEDGAVAHNDIAIDTVDVSGDIATDTIDTVDVSGDIATDTIDTVDVSGDTAVQVVDTVKTDLADVHYDSDDIDGFADTAVIRELFGDLRESADTAAADTAIILPPFEGDYRFLISPPVYAAYTEPKELWLSAVAEIYAYYKIASSSRAFVFTMEDVDGVLPNSRDRERHLSRTHYVEAGNRLGATHVIYQEYLPLSNGDGAFFAVTLFRVSEDAVEARVVDTVFYADIEGGLRRNLNKIMAFAAGITLIDSGVATANDTALTDADTAVAASVPLTAADTSFISEAFIFNNDRPFMEALGNALVIENAFAAERSIAAYGALEKLTGTAPKSGGFNYAAALLANRAQKYDRAIGHISAAMSGYGATPPLWMRLSLAGYLRDAGRYDEALKAAEAAGAESALKTAAAVETAEIYKAQGNLDAARGVYESIVIDGSTDGRVFFRLALLYARTGNIKGGEEVVAVAEQREIRLFEDEYYELGVVYGKINGGDETAVAYLNKSKGANLNDERAWLAIADVHDRVGNRELFADAIFNLFKINPRKHVDKAKIAGGIYEELGQFEKAKDVYRMFIARDFIDRDITFALARIYAGEKDCGRMLEMLNLQNLHLSPEAATLLGGCGLRLANQRLIPKPTARERIIIATRFSTGLVSIGAVAAGALFNNAVISEGRKYRDFAPEGLPPKNTDAEDYDSVLRMRNNIENNILYRNLFYSLSALSAAGFVVTFKF